MCCFTTHTPVEAGHDRFPYDLVQRVLGDFVDLVTLKHLAGEDSLDMTRLALNLSEYVNGVAKRHAEVSRRMFPGYRVHAVTNGVHPFTWTSEPFRAVYDAHLPGWCHEPELLVRVTRISDETIWSAHLEAKKRLIDHVFRLTGTELDAKLPIIGFGQRMTAYKRPDLLFSDMKRLEALARTQPFQIVYSGKAHPRDEPGKCLIETLYARKNELAGRISMAYIPDFNMATALLMVSGVDVWLNTPLPQLEASGTSGMKAAFNGVPQLSVLGGWWIEGCLEGVTGWAIDEGTQSGDDAAGSLHSKLEHVVLPLWHGNRAGWIAVMKGAIGNNASFFNSHRMMRRYATESYIR